MQPPTPPTISRVEVEAAQPSQADSAAITQLSADTNRSLPQVAHVVKVRLRTKPPVTSIAWRLYVNDVLIPKYWEYEDGIYFTVIDPQFFSDHKGQTLRFSLDGVDFYDTGMKLPAPSARAAESKPKPTAAKSSKKKAAKSSKKKVAKSSKKKATKSSKSKKR